MKLYIAEKPSMGAEIAKCLGNAKKINNSHFETDGGIVTWGYGHILRQAEPEEYNDRYKNWKAEDLPIIPDPWILCIANASKDQFKIIQKLIKEADEIVNAGDPDREGQLLIDEILEYVGNTKPVKRLLLQALDEKTIKKSLDDLRNNQDFYNLKQSALARARADWLIGMNLSRAITIAAQKAGHTNTFPIGRVKTPTTALVVRRENEIKNFKSINFFLIRAAFHHENGTYEAEWQPNDSQRNLDTEGRLINKDTANEIIKKIRDIKQPAVIANCIVTRKTDSQRLPFSLSALQIEAGKRFGHDPQTVLTTAQALYEKKLTTYPRSDCDFLPENQFSSSKAIIENLKKIDHKELALWSHEAEPSIRSRAWNDKKITAHHAIIPTEVPCPYQGLTDTEKDIYFLIAQVFIAQFYSNHEYEQTKIETTLADELFTTTGRVILVDGWKSLYRKDKEDTENDELESEESKVLPKVAINDSVEYMSGYVLDKKTLPPKRFTTTTLLQAMKEIYKFVKNPDLKKQLKDVSGIGTEATRASIIKEITTKGFLHIDKKYIVPSEQAYLLISLLPDELTYPDFTAEWEMAFEKMLEGSVKLEEFIKLQTYFIKNLCDKAATMDVKAAEGQACPSCGKGILSSRKGKFGVFWACSRFPECRTSVPDLKGKPDLNEGITCPICNKGKLRQREIDKSKFWSCSNYTECKSSFTDYKNKPQIIKCPTCKKGYLKKRKSGEIWGCSNFPECRATVKDEKGKPKVVK